MRKVVHVFMSPLVFFLGSPVYAAVLPNLQQGDVATVQSLEGLFTNVVNVVIALAGVALLLMFVIAGFSFLFSQGDQKKLEQARGTLTNAVIGLVVIVAAFLIIRIISVFTGVPQILKFTIPAGNPSAGNPSAGAGVLPKR
ncbi:MAG TPA: pilin [Patescibacteria group bacterium]|jgi:cytochrome bd-type quinol oxidase subunit 2|nr:pilin [Patescibacteria group bacterium]